MTNHSNVSYRDVAILAPGSFTDMSGKRISFSALDLQQIAERYGSGNGQAATLNLDHQRSGPALGRISALRYDAAQKLLLADIDGVPARLARAIEHGRWPGRSAELSVTRQADGSIASLALKGLALLGVRRPAVEGLPPMPPRSPAVVAPPAASAVGTGPALSATGQSGVGSQPAVNPAVSQFRNTTRSPAACSLPTVLLPGAVTLTDGAGAVPTADRAGPVPTSKLRKPHSLSFTGGLDD